jgi:hypothetical protein
MTNHIQRSNYRDMFLSLLGFCHLNKTLVQPILHSHRMGHAVGNCPVWELLTFLLKLGRLSLQNLIWAQSYMVCTALTQSFQNSGLQIWSEIFVILALKRVLKSQYCSTGHCMSSGKWNIDRSSRNSEIIVPLWYVNTQFHIMHVAPCVLFTGLGSHPWDIRGKVLWVAVFIDHYLC